MIRKKLRHPKFFDLSRYVDRGEDGADLDQMRIHLRDCTRCRDEVAWIKRLRDESGSLSDVEPPAGTLDRILERRAAGDRIILPVNAPAVDLAERRPLRWVGTGVAVAILAIVATISLTNRATAGSSNLTFTPRQPQPGETIKIHYVPTIGLAGADSLRLRVRFREADQPHDEESYPGDYLSITLFPDRDGVFEGKFALPLTVAYAQMAVEDTRATTVDSNNRRLWEIQAHNENGHVSYQALQQRAYMAEWAQDWRRRKQTSVEMTRLFPLRPEGWDLRFRYEIEFTDPARRDSVLAIHRAALKRLESDLEGREVAAIELAAMTLYADGLGAAAAAMYWERRLARVDPGHYLVQRRRAFRVFAEQVDAAKVLEAVEDAWLSSNPRDWNLAEMGLRQALLASQWDRAETWARRLTDITPDLAFTAGRLLAAHPPTRELGIDYLQQAANLSASNLDRIRPLSVDALVYERMRARRLQRILTQLAGALIESGHTEAAAGIIGKAADLGWDPLLLRQLADYRVAVGDTTSALTLLARAAADPLTGSETEERGHDLAVASGLGPPAWLQSVAQEREQFRRWTLEAAEFRHLPPDLTVDAANGDRVTVASLISLQPTLIAVTEFQPGRFVDSKLPHLMRLHDRLAERDFPFVVLMTTWDDGFNFGAFVDEDRLNFPLFYDSDNLADEFFGVKRTTEYVVLDADGMIRGTYWELNAALRLLYLLPRPPQVA